MTESKLGIGAVLFIKEFKFENGNIKDKLFVVLGAREGKDYLCAAATSKQWKMGATTGCHHNPRTYFYILGDGKNFFEQNTWILLSYKKIFKTGWLLNEKFQGRATIIGNLNQNITGQIRNCLKASKDISALELDLL